MKRHVRVISTFAMLISATFPLLGNADGKLNTNTTVHRPAPVATNNNDSGPVVSFSYSNGPSSEYNHNRRDSFRHQSPPVYQYQYDRGRKHDRDYRQDYYYQPAPYGNRPGYHRPEYRAPRVEPQFQSCVGSHCNNTKR